MSEGGEMTDFLEFRSWWRSVDLLKYAKLYLPRGSCFFLPGVFACEFFACIFPLAKATRLAVRVASEPGISADRSSFGAGRAGGPIL